MEILNAFKINSGVLSSKIEQGIQNAKHVREPFSDTDILNLQDAFLSNGTHYFKVNSIQEGRSIINLFLASLNYYKNIGCLTMNPGSLQESASDLYSELLLGGHLDKKLLYELETFFLEEFYYDFIWIEATQNLLSGSWATAFFKQMIQFKLDHLIPILIISYKK